MKLRNNFFIFLSFILISFNSNAESKWIPISSSDITIFIPSPEVVVDEATPYSSGEDISIRVGNVGASQAYYYRAIDSQTGYQDAWQCKTGSQVAAAGGNIVVENHPNVGKYKFEVAACMSGNTCNVGAFSSGALACSSNVLSKQVEVANVSGTRGVSDLGITSDNIELTAAQFKVSEMGAATYSVPIKIPSGTAGVQPQVALTYSSIGGSGILGQGWNVSASSGISRCPKSIVYDNKQDGISYSNNDRLCLNGQRLILSKSTRTLANSQGTSDSFTPLTNAITGYRDPDAEYWAKNAVYTTAKDSFSVIKPHYSGESLRVFTVENKAGEIHYYGDHKSTSQQTSLTGINYNSVASIPRNTSLNNGNSDALQIPQNSPATPRAWLLKIVQDVKYNYFYYVYDTNFMTGENYLKEINYTGNTVQSLQPYAKVIFNYRDSKKISAGWVAGSSVLSAKLMTSIEVQVDGQEYRSYSLDYFESSFFEEKTHLETITESVAQENLKSLTFKWNKAPVITTSTKKECFNEDFGPDGKTEVCFPVSTTDSFKAFQSQKAKDVTVDNYHLAKIFDFNGDGYSDIVYPNNGWRVKYGPTYTKEKTLIANTKLQDNAQYAQVFDYDGDGVQDLLIAENSYSKWQVITEKLNVHQGQCSYLGGDLQTVYDTCVPSTYSTNVVQLELTAHGLQSGLRIMDIDGDADLDLVYNKSSRSLNVYYYENQGNGKFSSEKLLLSLPEGNFSDDEHYGEVEHRIHNGRNQYAKSAGFANSAFFDIDGDGKTELLIGRQSELITCYEDDRDERDGRGGSGRDVCGVEDSEKVWYLYSAKNWLVPLATYSGNAFSNPRVVDLNGDGLSDILWKGRENKLKYRLSDGKILLDEKYAKTSSGGNVFVSSEQDKSSYYLDVTADGRTDLLIATANRNGWMTYFSMPVKNNPSMVVFQRRGSMPFIKDAFLQFGDVNGDGKLDLLQGKNNSWQVNYSRGAGQLYDVIKRSDNGYGVKTFINYANITGKYDNFRNNVVKTYLGTESSQAYKEDGELHHDYVSPKAGMFVVSRVDTDVTYANTLSVLYQYGGLLLHKNGYGNLGFERLRTIDPQTCTTKTITTPVKHYEEDEGVFYIRNQESKYTDYNSCVTTETTYHQLAPYTGLPKQTVQSFGVGDNKRLMSIANNTWAHQQSANGAVQVYLKESKEQSYALNKSLTTSTRISTTTTTNTENIYGNVTNSSIHLTDAASSANDVMTQTTHVYSGKINSEKLGRLSHSRVTSYRKENGIKAPVSDNNQNNIVRDARFTYDTTGLLKTDTTAYGTTTYSYDKWGNKSGLSFSANDATNSAATRSSSTVFDSRGRFAISKKVNGNSNYENTIIYYGSAGRAGSSPKGRITKVVSTSAHGASKEVTFNSFGRPTQTVHKTAGNQPELIERSYTNFCVNNCGIPGAYVKLVSQSSGSPEKQVYLDRWGRELVAKVKRASDFGGGWFVQEKYYTSQGRLLTSSASGINTASSEITTTSYDVFGRPTKQERPRGKTEMEYDGLSTITKVYDNGVVAATKVETNDYSGQLINVTTKAGTKVLTTLAYQYNADNKLLQATANGRVQVINTINSLGQKVTMNDADKGIWHYKYNDHGELYQQTNSDNQATSFIFDVFGRKSSRLDVDGLTCWQYNEYDLAGTLAKVAYKKGAGQNHNQCSQLEGANYQEEFTYRDNLKLGETKTTIDGELFTTSLHYDDYNRVKYTKYPAKGFSVEHQYNEFSQPISLKNPNTNEVYSQVNNIDERGNVTDVTYGNGVTSNKIYDYQTGFIDTIGVSGRYINVAQTYQFDDLGNLKERTHSYGTGNASHNFCEKFGYDNLQRLDDSTVYAGNTNCATTAVTTDFNYDTFGNLKKKGNSGTYTYYSGTNRLHTVGNKTFIYDNRGNTTTDGQRNFVYSSFDKATLITKGNISTTMSYGYARNLYKRVDVRSDGVTESLYVKGLYERIKTANNTEHKFYVGNAVITKRDSGITDETFYLHKDHLGSATSVTDKSGRVVQHVRYDAWGKQYRFQTAGSLANSTMQSSPVESRGYTGHKELSGLDITHMKGRIYDANIGRFMQADPIIQAPTDSLSYNRYSYVRNNPLSLTDPSGFSWLSKLWKKVKPFIGAIVAVVVSIWCPACGATIWNATMTGAAIGAASAAINGGNILKGALIGGLSGAIFQQIGANFNGAETSGFFAEGGLGHVAAHGLAGGVTSVLQGGKFGHGFLAAGLTKALNVNKIIGTAAKNGGLRVATAAVIGGTVSKITGGKFSNGAITAAFAQAFNGNPAADREENWKKSVNAIMHDVANIDRNTLEGRARLAAYLTLDGQASNLDEAYGLLSDKGRALSLHFKLNQKLVNSNYKNSVSAFRKFVGQGIDDAKNFKMGLDIAASASQSIRLQGVSYVFDMKTLIDAGNLGQQLTADYGVLGLADQGQSYLLNKHGN